MTPSAAIRSESSDSESEPKKKASVAWTEAMIPTFYFFVAFTSMNGIQFFPSIETSYFIV